MKILSVFLTIITICSSASALPSRKYYINTPRGPVQVVTPQNLRESEKRKEQQTEGVGQEFYGEVKVTDGAVSAYIRGCNYVKIGDSKDETLEPEEKERLLKLRNGDRIRLKMESYGGCTVGGWRK